MKIFFREEGNVSLIVTAILLFMTTVGLSVLSMTSTDLKSAFNVSWKAKSDALVEFALEEYRDRLNELFIQEDKYYTEDVDLSLLNTTPFYVMENGEKEADIEFFDVSFVSTVFDTTYEYLNSLTATGNTDGVVLYKNPPVDDAFEMRNYADIVGSGPGIISADSIFSKAYNANEFFISKMNFDSNTGLPKELRLFNHFPMIETTTDTPLVISTKADLETSMNGAYSLDNMTLDDDVTIDAVWDETFNSPKIVMSISVAEENLVHIFTLTPIMDTQFQYFDSLSVSEKILQAEIKTNFDMNANSVIATLNLLTERTKTQHVLTTYPIYLPLDTNIDLTRKVEMVVPDTSRTISTSMFWNDSLKTTQLYAFSAEDDAVLSAVDFNSKISIYLLNVGIDGAFEKEDEISLDSFGINKVHKLGSDVFWNSSLKDGFVNLLFASPNETDAKGEYKLFHLETTVFNFDKSEVREIDTVSKGISNVGRVSVTGTSKSEFGEMMVFLEKAFVKIEKVLLKNTAPQNITISSYEDNKSGRIGAKTKVIIEPEIEVTTVMDSNVRFIKSFNIKDMVVE